jgi:hypothetical protein
MARQGELELRLGLASREPILMAVFGESGAGACDREGHGHGSDKIHAVQAPRVGNPIGTNFIIKKTGTKKNNS